MRQRWNLHEAKARMAFNILLIALIAVGHLYSQTSISLPADFPPKAIAFQQYDFNTGLFTPLRFAGNWTLGPHATYTTAGPTYWPPAATFPYIQSDQTRGLVVVGPGTFSTKSAGAIVSVGVPSAGSYTVSGAFARANDARNAGDGVRVVAFVNGQIGAPLFDAVISSDNAVDPGNIFGGTGIATFNFLASLAQGDVIRFGVFSGPSLLDGTFDETAIQFTITGGGTSVSFPSDFPPKPIAFQEYNHAAAAFLPLRFAGIQTVGNGDIASTGPLYTSETDFYPYVMLDTARNLFLFHPGTFATVQNAAVVTVGIPTNGRYSISGAFARANDFQGAGDGVSVGTLVNGTAVFNTVISSNNAVNPNDPFSGTGAAPFSLAVPLSRGDNVQFAVLSGPTLADGTFDVTALKFSVTALSGQPPDWNLAFSQPAVARASMNMVFDSGRQTSVMFGGRDGSFTPLADTYEYGNAGWSRVLTPHSPAARYWAGMAYDDHRKRTVLFGGTNLSTAFSDTWEYDGYDWANIPTAHGPVAQGELAMTYDSCRQKTVALDVHQGTWEYDGLDWTQVATGTQPPARALAALVFDPFRCRTILFGGASTAYVGLADTWEYDGVNWTQISTGTSPSGRWAHAMAFDTNRARTILFGGYGPVYPTGTQTNDTWEYDGTSWVQIYPLDSPSQREQHGMVYDQTRLRGVMFGGFGGSDGGTWQYAPMGAITLVPSQGTNDQSVSVVLSGSAQLSGASVRLSASGLSDIPGTNTVSSSPATLQSTFNLSGATAGARDVVITTAGGSGITLYGAFTITQVPPCTYSISPSGQSFASPWGSGSFVVTASSTQCTWNSSFNANWITPGLRPQICCVPSPVVSYSVAANSSAAQRSGTITITSQNVAQATFTITQAGQATCTYAISSASQSFSAAGGTASVQVTAPGGCAWVVTGNPGWLTFPSGTSGSGNGTANINVPTNTGLSRSASLTIAGKPFSISQAAVSACGAVDVSGPIHVSQGVMVISSLVTSTYSRKITLTNTSAQTVPGPIYLVLDGLPNFTLAGCQNGCGLTPWSPVTHCQSPSALGSYLFLWSPAAMLPGQSITLSPGYRGGSIISLQQYTTRVLSGTPNQ